jgi:hypothetical protein
VIGSAANPVAGLLPIADQRMMVVADGPEQQKGSGPEQLRLCKFAVQEPSPLPTLIFGSRRYALPMTCRPRM